MTINDVQQPSIHTRTQQHMRLQLHPHFGTQIELSCSLHKSCKALSLSIRTAKPMVPKKPKGAETWCRSARTSACQDKVGGGGGGTRRSAVTIVGGGGAPKIMVGENRDINCRKFWVGLILLSPILLNQRAHSLKGAGHFCELFMNLLFGPQITFKGTQNRSAQEKTSISVVQAPAQPQIRHCSGGLFEQRIVAIN